MFLSGIRTIRSKPLYNPQRQKTKKYKKKKTTEEGKAFLSACGTKDESKIDEKN